MSTISVQFLSHTLETRRWQMYRSLPTELLLVVSTQHAYRPWILCSVTNQTSMREKERCKTNWNLWSFSFSVVGSVAREVRVSTWQPEGYFWIRNICTNSLSLSHKQNPLLSLAPSLIPRPLPDFLHSCKIKSRSGLRTRLTHSLSLYFYLSLSPSLPPSLSLRCPSSVSVQVCSPQWSTPTQYRTKNNEPVNVINRCSCTAWSWPSWRPSLGYITISRLPSVSFVWLLLACVDHSLDHFFFFNYWFRLQSTQHTRNHFFIRLLFWCHAQYPSRPALVHHWFV